MYKLVRLLSLLAAVALLAASCTGQATIELSAETEPENQSAASASSSDTTEPTAVPATSVPEPTAVAAEPTPEPAANGAESQETTGQDQDPTTTFDDEGEPFLESRDDAIAFLVGEGFVSGDAECLAEGAFQVFGTWDFIDLDATPEQDEVLDTLLDTCITTIPGPAAGSPPPGTDARFDALWIACDGGSASACDELYFESPLDSDYEAFGFSCGGRTVEICSDVLGDDSGDSTSGAIEGPAAGSAPPGTDAELDALWVACNEGSGEACDDLYWQSPLGSDYEAFGYSCGGRAVAAACSDLLDG